MRCAPGVLIAITIVASAIGCRSQSTPLTNPFLTPQRVPPPSTRVLTPGTAQPYYPGDPMPGSAPASVPFGGFPATTAPPATAYPGAFPTSSPVTPGGQVTPPGGWGVSGPRADSTAVRNLTAGDAVTIPNDQQQMRFASTTLAAPTSPTAIVTPPATMAATPAFAPNAGTTHPIQQAAYDEAPASGQPGFQTLQQREVTRAEYVVPSGAMESASPTATTARDGFRPQGSDPRPESTSDSSATKGFRPPSIGNGAAVDSNARYGVGPSQEWLRGQLEYWPTSGEWSIKYMADGAVDQIGGRILIDNPQVLGHLPPGEFVVVEGQVFGRQIDDVTYRPAYRVAVVQRQQK
ncbi:MAG: hypothetical protein H0T51_15685 [Pirellulales bacterium]|nr:hypothetical protein [Pirellulales bacterium]